MVHDQHALLKKLRLPSTRRVSVAILEDFKRFSGSLYKQLAAEKLSPPVKFEQSSLDSRTRFFTVKLVAFTYQNKQVRII